MSVSTTKVAYFEIDRAPIGSGVLYRATEAHALAETIAEVADVTIPDFSMPVRNLSGGNQQRLVARREMRIARRLLVAAYPSRGLDIGAIASMHRYFASLRDEGVAVVIDRGHVGHDQLLAARNMVLGRAAQDKRLMAVRPNGMEDAPQYHLDIDREKANALGVSVADINTLVNGALGSIYVNQFMRDDRVKQVYIQGMPSSRMVPVDRSRGRHPVRTAHSASWRMFWPR